MRFAFLAFFISISAFAAEVVVTKNNFIDDFQKRLPDSFCAEKTYFRKCFETTEEKCHKIAAAATAECVSSVEAGMPAQLRQPTDGQNWGEKIGTCAGKKIEANTPKLKKLSADCKDASKWK